MDKIKKIKLGSVKNYRGFEINKQLCIKLDPDVLDFESWFQVEIIKGDKIAFSRELPKDQLLTEVEDYIYKKIDELIEEEIKSWHGI